MLDKIPFTEEHHRDHEAALQEIGFHESEIHRLLLDTGATPGPMVLSSDANRSHIRPRFVTVMNLKHLKAFTGIPETKSTDIEAPEPWPESKNRIIAKAKHSDHLKVLLPLKDQQRIAHAYRLAVQGYSHLVPSYEDIINAFFFPHAVSAFGGDGILVRKNNPLILKAGINEEAHAPNPHKLVFKALILEDGAQIASEVPAHFTIQYLKSGTV